MWESIVCACVRAWVCFRKVAIVPCIRGTRGSLLGIVRRPKELLVSFGAHPPRPLFSPSGTNHRSCFWSASCVREWRDWVLIAFISSLMMLLSSIFLLWISFSSCFYVFIFFCGSGPFLLFFFLLLIFSCVFSCCFFVRA